MLPDKKQKLLNAGKLHSSERRERMSHGYRLICGTRTWSHPEQIVVLSLARLHNKGISLDQLLSPDTLQARRHGAEVLIDPCHYHMHLGLVHAQDR